MKLKLLGCLYSLTVITAVAQQYAPHTHFYQNSLIYNPAIAGTEDEIPIRVNFRQQWSGMDDAPTSQTLSSHAFVGRNVGLGLVLYNDLAGPSRNTGFQASAARHFALDKEGKRWLSFGLSLMLYQYKFDLSRLRTDIPNDPAVIALATQNSRITPDMTSGVYINDENGFIGFSCMNMIQNKQNILDQSANLNTVMRTYYMFAGYRFPLNKDVSIEPVAFVKVTEARVWQADMMVKANYNKCWAGLSYRTGDAASLLAGFRVDMFSFAYSYDYPVTGIGNYNRGTHEITAAVHIFNATSRQGPLERIEPADRRHGFNKAPRRRR